MPQRQLASGKATGLVTSAVKRLILSRASILAGVWGRKDREGPMAASCRKGAVPEMSRAR